MSASQRGELNLPISTQANTVHLGCQTNAWRIPRGNFQGFLAVLDRIRSYGFEGFETGFQNVEGVFAHSREAQVQIEQKGIRFFGVHIFLLQYDPKTCLAPEDLIRRVAAGAAELGAGCLILSGEATSALEHKTDALSRAAEYCLQEGLPLAYHNHPHEFHQQGAEVEWLVSGTDPKRVSFVLDVGHVHLAGGDALAFFRQHHGRITALHLRDFREEEQVPVGRRTLDLLAWKKAIEECSWTGWALVEEERPNDGRPGDTAVAPASQALRRTFRTEEPERRNR
jgi:sugar phosphate isomerase/epimerase